MAPSAPNDTAGTAHPVLLVVDAPCPAAWQADVVRRVRESDVLSLAGVTQGPGSRPRRSWLWRTHRALERRVFGGPPDPFASVRPDWPAAGAGEAGATLVLWLVEQPPPATEAARFGAPVMWLGHGPSAGPLCAEARRAVRRAEAVIETQVRMSRPEAAGSAVAARSFGGVRPYSLWLTESAVMWKSAHLLVRTAEAVALRRIGAAGGDDASSGARAHAGRSWGFLVLSAVRWAGVLTHRARYRRPWRILVGLRDGTEAPPTGWSSPEHPVAWAPGHVYADPFLFEHEDRHHLFCEVVAPGTSRGVIGHVELVRGQPALAPRPVLERPHHLSYPFVFAHGGEVFMIPETVAARRVELLRAVAFPHEWVTDTILVDDVHAADATIVEHDGRLWMFVAIAAPGAGLLDELHVYWAADPRGPWTAHQQNPVVSDVRHSRPAGRILSDDGRLIRPAQDGSRRYGGAVCFREVVRLTPTEYEERPSGRLAPDAIPGAQALHTYARDSVFEAIDVRCRTPRVAWLRLRRPARRSRRGAGRRS